MTHDPADATLVSQMQRDDAAGLRGLYDRHAGRVFGLARRMLGAGSDAEDVAQEVFLQAWAQRHRYDETRGAVPTWLLAIARSRAFDRLRARVRVDGHEPEREASSSAEAAMDGPVREACDRGCLATLTAGQRVAVELAYYDGYTHTEIAARLKQPIGTIQTRIRGALLKLRDERV